MINDLFKYLCVLNIQHKNNFSYDKNFLRRK